MNTYSVKAFLVLVLAVLPMSFISLGGWLIPLIAASWYFAYRLVTSLIRDAEREERRAAGQADQRSRRCVERRTRSHYNR
jgi:hypothetical protein